MPDFDTRTPQRRGSTTGQEQAQQPTQQQGWGRRPPPSLLGWLFIIGLVGLIVMIYIISAVINSRTPEYQDPVNPLLPLFTQVPGRSVLGTLRSTFDRGESYNGQ